MSKDAAVQVVAECVMDLDHYIFRRVKFGEEEIEGGKIFKIEPPRKGFPAWKVYAREDWTGDGALLVYVVTGAIMIEATEIEVVEPTKEEEE